MARRRDARTDDALVVAAREGDRDAFAELFTRWFDRVYDVARNIVRNAETAAEVAQDAFVAAWTGLSRLDRPEAFGGWLLRIARNRALDRLRRDGRTTSLGADDVTELHDDGLRAVGGTAAPVLSPDEIVVAQDRDGLIAAAAAALGARDASLLDLHLRHGLSPAEIAEELGVTPNNAHQLLFRMRGRLGEAIGAFVLWRRGRPSCPALASALAGADPAFDQSVLAIIEQHARGCADCVERRAALVAPAQLFTAIPLVAAPAALRARVMDGLRAADVPVPRAVAGPRRWATLAAAAILAIGLVALLAVWFARGGDDTPVAIAADVPTTVPGGDPRSGSTTSGVPTTIGPRLATATTAAPPTVATTSTTTTSPPTTTAVTSTTAAVTTTGPRVAPPPPPPTAPAATTPPATTAASTTTVKPPKLVRFTVAPGPGLLCGVGTPRHFEWASIGGASAVLTIAGTQRNVAASGTHDACASSGATAKIVVTGPGGTAQRSLVVP